MYKTDKRGEYRIKERWAKAWAGGGAYVAGFCICELREYTDGTLHVHTSDPRYIHDNLELGFAHKVYIQAQKELGV